jgi:hypothetical protein
LWSSSQCGDQDTLLDVLYTMPVMTLAEFDAAVAARRQLPAGTAPLLTALWHDATGDWDRAHTLAQDVETADGAWVHAYLHRKEGDTSNARYWYRRAGRRAESGALDDERRTIVAALLGE